MNLWNKKKYKIIFLRKQFNAMFIEKVLKLQNIKPIVKFGKKEFHISIENTTYITKKNVKVYFFDYDSGNQLSFIEIEKQLNPDELDLIIGQNLIKELTSGVIDNKKEKILWMVIGVIMGALLAIVITMSIYTNRIQELMQEFNDSIPLYPVLPT